MKCPGFITVRTGSTRLPNKCLLPFGEGNVLEHILMRTEHYDLDPIICTTIEPEDNVIEKLAMEKGVKCFRGSVKHKLKRWLDCCNHFKIDKFHTIDADDPFFDGELMKKSYLMLSNDYDMIYPTKSSSAGGASVGYSLTREIVDKACLLADKNSDTEMMWYYVEKVPGLRSMVLEEQDSDPITVRLTLDYEEDYWLLSTIQRIIGSLASRREVDDLFRRNPDLYKINWFRNQEWKKKQLDKKV